jgi:hypothetical protein
MDDYVTIAEAATITGRSVSTIRRIVRRIASEANQDVVKKAPGVTNERYLIRRDYLLKELNVEEQEASEPEDHEGFREEVVTILREELQKRDEQLKKKDEQLQTKDEQIAQFLERQRETNILMNHYQQRLLSVAPAEVEQQPAVQPPALQPSKPSFTWVWLLIGILILLAIVIFVVIRDGLLTFPWLR